MKRPQTGILVAKLACRAFVAYCRRHRNWGSGVRLDGCIPACTHSARTPIHAHSHGRFRLLDAPGVGWLWWPARVHQQF